jgi:hypothetical protein
LTSHFRAVLSSYPPARLDSQGVNYELLSNAQGYYQCVVQDGKVWERDVEFDALLRRGWVYAGPWIEASPE